MSLNYRCVEPTLLPGYRWLARSSTTLLLIVGKSINMPKVTLYTSIEANKIGWLEFYIKEDIYGISQKWEKKLWSISRLEYNSQSRVNKPKLSQTSMHPDYLEGG